MSTHRVLRYSVLHSTILLYLNVAVAQYSNATSMHISNNNITSSCLSHATAFNRTNVANSTYVAPNECCETLEPCYIFADSCQVLYWESQPANLTVLAPSTLSSDSYIFTSPSIYVIYHSIFAGAGSRSCIGNVGDGGRPELASYATLTQAYPPGYLTTGHCYHGVGARGILNPQDFATTIQNWVYETRADCVNGASLAIGGPNGTDLHGNPSLVVPGDFSSVDPQWSGCRGNDVYGAFDPPRALSPVAALDPTTTISLPSSMVSAEPGTVATFPFVSPTPVSSSGKTTTLESIGQNQDPPAIGQSTASSGPQTPRSSTTSGKNAVWNSQGNPNDEPSSSNNLGGAKSIAPVPADPQITSAESQTDGGQLAVPVPAPALVPGHPESTIVAPDPAHAPSQGPESPGNVVATSNDVSKFATVAGLPMSILPNNGGVAVDGITIAPGSQTVIAGHGISVGSKQAVIGTSTFDFPPLMAATALPMYAGQSLQAAPRGGLEVGGIILSAGYRTVVSGTPLSVGSSQFVIGSSTYAFSDHAIVPYSEATAPPLEAVPGNNRAVKLGSTTLSAGDPAVTFAGSTFSVLSGGGGVMVDGNVAAMPKITARPSVFTIGGQVLTIDPSKAVLGLVTLPVGGAAVTISGAVMSYGPSGLRVGSTTYPLFEKVPQSLWTVAGQVITAYPGEVIVGSGTTLHPGDPPLTISGTVVSMGPSGLQIGSSTFQIGITALSSSLFTVVGETITANPTEAVVGSTTLHPGGSAITISGTVISLGPSGLEIGSTIMPLTPAALETALGSLIMSALGGAPESTTSTGLESAGSNSTARFTGGGQIIKGGYWIMGAMSILAVAVGMLAFALWE